MTRKQLLFILVVLLLPLYACASAENFVSEKRQVPGSAPTEEEAAALRNIQFPSAKAKKGAAIILEENLIDEQQYHGYRVRIYLDKEMGRDGYLEISKDGSIIYCREGGVFRIGLVHVDIPDDALVKIGSDITKDGIPNLVISEKTPEAVSSIYFYVFSLGKKFNLLDKIDAGRDEGARFKDVDRDGIIEFYLRDLTFNYWHSNLTDSPKPKVVFKYRDGKYRLALDVMQKRAPDSEDIQEEINKIQARAEQIRRQRKEESSAVQIDELYYSAWIKFDAVIPSQTWEYMLELIYSGNYQLAWEFLDKAWPKANTGKEEFKLEFKLQLAKSKYWTEIAKNI